MRVPFLAGALLVSLALAPSAVVGQTLEERQAELKRKLEEAKKKADERKAKAAAAGGSSNAGTGGSSSTASAGKSSAGAGGVAATASGGAGGSGGKGGAGGKGGGGGTAGKGGAGGAGGAAVKDQKDAPLPAADIETLRKDRPERRKTTVERLRKRWGSLLANDKGASDLKLHARRVAFLQRIRVVAEAKKDVKTIEAVDELLTREDERHTKAMNALREGALPSGASR